MLTKRSRGVVFVVCTILFLFLATAQVDPAWAHRMLVGQEEPGKLFVYYEGETPAALAVVTLYDAQGVEVKEGTVDEAGYFFYDPWLPVVRAVADDGMGHRAEIALDEPEAASVSTAAKTAFGLALLAFVSAFFWYWSQRRK